MLPVTTQNTKLLGCYMVKPHGQLVLVSFITLLNFHTQPINVVVFDGPSGELKVPSEISS